MVTSRRRIEQYRDADFAPLIPAETKRIKELYAEGIVRHIWHRDDGRRRAGSRCRSPARSRWRTGRKRLIRRIGSVRGDLDLDPHPLVEQAADQHGRGGRGGTE